MDHDAAPRAPRVPRLPPPGPRGVRRTAWARGLAARPVVRPRAPPSAARVPASVPRRRSRIAPVALGRARSRAVARQGRAPRR